ncbi:MAG TPA: type II toxin-antitoxin system RelE/ParE family toxin [Nitrospiraceae bacterium]|nr:type II toxin-antitoxin system RelE/ParE family toxin [Nitrospiraceae bacterium]
MTPFRTRYTPEAAERIRKLHPQIKQEIRDGIRTLLNNPLAGRALHSELSGYWSYRIRTYRVIYEVNEERSSLDVIFIGPRRNVYEELRAFLLEQPR